MEELKLIMDDVMKNREDITKIKECAEYAFKVHNNLADSHINLVKKHNKLCKSMAMMSVAMIGLDLLIMWNAYDIHKLKKEKENKEG